MPSIHLKTEIPGPNSRALLARRAAAVPNGLGKATDVVVDRADGALVHDVDGNTLIDFVGGIGALAVGHCPPSVVDAMHAEAQKIFGEKGYRPVVKSVADTFDYPTPPSLSTIADFGGWGTVKDEFFDPENGIVAKIEMELGVSTDSG